MPKRGELASTCKNGHDLTLPDARRPKRGDERGAGECRLCSVNRWRRYNGSTKTGPPSLFGIDETERLKALAAGCKLCVRCRESKPQSEYGRQSKTHDGLNTYCKTCRSAMKQAAYLANRDELRLRSRARTFGITVDHLRALIAAQGPGCAICGNPCVTGRALALDHDHATGQLRGLLCANCNRGIGILQDSPEILEAALAYLRKWKGCHAEGNESLHGLGVSRANG